MHAHMTVERECAYLTAVWEAREREIVRQFRQALVTPEFDFVCALYIQSTLHGDVVSL